MTEIRYRIRNPAGLYSLGGMDPFWSRKGKTWDAKSLRAHFAQIGSPSRVLAVYRDCIVVQRVVTVEESDAGPAGDFVGEWVARLEGRRNAAKDREARETVARELALLRELKAKYGHLTPPPDVR